jgi:hypothetical protein
VSFFGWIFGNEIPRGTSTKSGGGYVTWRLELGNWSVWNWYGSRATDSEAHLITFCITLLNSYYDMTKITVASSKQAILTRFKRSETRVPERKPKAEVEMVR